MRRVFLFPGQRAKTAFSGVFSSLTILLDLLFQISRSSRGAASAVDKGVFRRQIMGLRAGQPCGEQAGPWCRPAGTRWRFSTTLWITHGLFKNYPQRCARRGRKWPGGADTGGRQAVPKMLTDEFEAVDVQAESRPTGSGAWRCLRSDRASHWPETRTCRRTLACRLSKAARKNVAEASQAGPLGHRCQKTRRTQRFFFSCVEGQRQVFRDFFSSDYPSKSSISN